MDRIEKSEEKFKQLFLVREQVAYKVPIRIYRIYSTVLFSGKSFIRATWMIKCGS